MKVGYIYISCNFTVYKYYIQCESSVHLVLNWLNSADIKELIRENLSCIHHWMSFACLSYILMNLGIHYCRLSMVY